MRRDGWTRKVACSGLISSSSNFDTFDRSLSVLFMAAIVSLKLNLQFPPLFSAQVVVLGGHVNSAEHEQPATPLPSSLPVRCQTPGGGQQAPSNLLSAKLIN